MTLTSGDGALLLPENFVDTVFHQRTSGEGKTPSWSLLSKGHVLVISSSPRWARGVFFSLPRWSGQDCHRLRKIF